jgi:hypothetical protein
MECSNITAHIAVQPWQTGVFAILDIYLAPLLLKLQVPYLHIVRYGIVHALIKSPLPDKLR